MTLSNGTYDGDNLSGLIAISRQQELDFMHYRPHYAIFSHTYPHRLNGNMSLPEVDVGILAHWIEEEDWAIAGGNIDAL